MKHAGFWKRFVAFMIDTIPITLIVFAVFFIHFGFDEALKARLNNPNNLEIRAEFLQQRNLLRIISFLIWMTFCLLLEASPLQGTVGKKMMGIKVVNSAGKRASFIQILARTMIKVPSYFVLCIGFIWVAFTKEKQGWHDKLAKTFVIDKDSVIQEERTILSVPPSLPKIS